jgi:hypothetical protein
MMEMNAHLCRKIAGCPIRSEGRTGKAVRRLTGIAGKIQVSTGSAKRQ